jgi:hypothetical protein
MKLEIEYAGVADVSTEAELRDRLQALELDRHSFAILSRSDNDFIQALLVEGGAIVERKDAADGKQYFAAYADGRTARTWDLGQHILPREEAFAILAAYLAGAPLPADLAWQPLAGYGHPVPASTRVKAFLFIGALLIAAAIGIWRIVGHA